MRTTEQTLNLAIGELRCIDPNSPLTLTDLHAASVARECIEEFLRVVVSELRTAPGATATWAQIAATLGEDSTPAARKRFTTELELENEDVAAFWEVFADRFVWDFLSVDFLHTLYVEWMSAERPAARALPPRTFTRRLMPLLTDSAAWSYARKRARSRMTAPEPLRKRIPSWSPPADSRALWGFSRS